MGFNFSRRMIVLGLLLSIAGLTAHTNRADAADDSKSVIAWLKTKGVEVEADASGSVEEVLLASIDPNVKWTDADLLRLKALKGLRKLSLVGASFTPDGLAKLAELPSLAELHLNGGLGGKPSENFKDEHLKAVGKLKKLKSFDFGPGQPVTTLEPLAGLTELESLNLVSSEGLTDAGFKHIAGMKGLKSINLFSSKITTLAPLAGLSKLESVKIADSPITDAGIKPIAGLKTLVALELPISKLTNASLATIGGLTELKELDLSRTAVSDLKPIAGLTKLTELGLSLTKVNDAALKHLAAMKSMEIISLNGTEVSDIAVLRGMPNLLSVYLEKTKIDDADLEHLTGFKKDEPGEILVGDGTKVTKQGAEKLQKLYPKKYIY